MYTIETGDIVMHLEVVRVESLQEHEETLPHVADSLSLEFKNWAHLHNPIIIDENHIVLDGNHRTFVFKKLGFRFISVCRIDYYSDNIGLRYWFRVLTGIRSTELMRQIVEDAGASIDPLGSREALAAALRANPLASGLEFGEYRAIVRFPEIARDAVSAYEAIERLQQTILSHGAQMKYVPCQSVSQDGFCEQIEKNSLVLWTPHITKDMVVDAAKCGRVFTPKATRHLVAARPINVNVPIRWFREDVSLKTINERFEGFLREKEMRRFPPGQVINGRYYGEEVFVFFDKKT